MSYRDYKAFLISFFVLVCLYIGVVIHSGFEQQELLAQAVECIKSENYTVVIDGIKVPIDTIDPKGITNTSYVAKSIDESTHTVYLEYISDDN